MEHEAECYTGMLSYWMVQFIFNFHKVV